MKEQHDHPHREETTARHGDDCNVTAKPQQTIALNAQATAEQLTTLRVEGMDCADEVAALERVLKPVAGIREFKVSLMAGRVTITHEKKLSTDDLVRAVGKAGLKARAIVEGQGEETSASAQRARLIAVILSGVFTGLGLLMQWQKIAEPYGPLVAFIIAILAGGWFIAPKALRAVRQLSLDMNVLMTVAVIGAAIIGEWSVTSHTTAKRVTC